LPGGSQNRIFRDVRLDEREALCGGDDRLLFLGFLTAWSGIRLSIV
jgi:hypothetical protein